MNIGKKSTLFFFLLLIHSINSKELHVSISTNGNDLNNGSINLPFKSLDYAFTKLNENDTLFIHEGTYYISETIKIKSNCLITNYRNEKAVIKFLNKLNNWEPLGNDIWVSNFKDSIIQLFINDKPFFQASYPNIQENIYAIQNGAFSIAYPNKEIYIEGISKFSNLTNCNFLGIHGKKLVSINGKIISQKENLVTIQNNSFCWNEEHKAEYLDTGKTIIYGSKDFIDAENEWFWEKGKLYIKSKINPYGLSTEVRSKIYSMDLFESNNVKINGLTFFAGNLNLIDSKNCEIMDCKFLYPTPFFNFPDGFEKYNQLLNDSSTYYQLKPEEWSGKGLTISGNNNTIENCFIAHSWGDGLTIWGNNHNIINNDIYDCNWISNDCANLTINGSGHNISNNSIHFASRSLLIHRNLENSKIKFNELFNNGINCGDLGMTASYFTDGKNTEIAYNYLHDSKSIHKSHGIYLDNGNSNFSVHHNIINNCMIGIQLNKPAENIQLFNNSIYNSIYSMGSWAKDGSELSNVITFNNLTNSNYKTKFYNSFFGTKIDSNHVYFDNNIFIDPDNHNFNLKKYSYLIDKGIINEYTLPFKGKAPEPGAIESDSDPIEYGASLIIENEQHYPPKAPIKLKLTNNTPTSTILAWEYPFNYIDSFYLERKISGDTFKIIAKLPALTLIYNDSTQPPGEYRYRVKALNKYGISDPSNSVEIFNPKFENSLFLDAENNDINFGTTKSGDIIINNDNKDWIAFKQINFSENKYDACVVNMAVPCEQAWQEVQVRIDRPMGRMIGNYTTTSTGAWDKFEQRTFPIEPITGYHDIYIKFKGEAGIGSFDWFNLYNSNGTVRKTYPQATNNCPQERNTSRQIPITIYPNPSTEEVAVVIENIETSTITIKFANLNGVLWLNKTYTNQLPGTQEYYLHNEINIPQLEKGMYIIEITVAGKRVTQTKNYKFIIN